MYCIAEMPNFDDKRENRPFENKKAQTEVLIHALEEEKLVLQDKCYEEMKRKNALLKDTIDFKIFSRPVVDAN